VGVRLLVLFVLCDGIAVSLSRITNVCGQSHRSESMALVVAY